MLSLKPPPAEVLVGTLPNSTVSVFKSCRVLLKWCGFLLVEEKCEYLKGICSV